MNNPTIEVSEKGRERSWALSAVLALIDDRELERIFRKMTVPDLDRFNAVVEGYQVDVKARDDAMESADD